MGTRSNIKSCGVTILQIDTDGSGQSSVPPACVGNPNNFFMLTQVGNEIAKLPVAK
jgi:hypothetical protein